jgi:hypothetical protein
MTYSLENFTKTEYMLGIKELCTKLDIKVEDGDVFTLIPIQPISGYELQVSITVEHKNVTQ